MTTRVLIHVTILLLVMLVMTACHDVGINVHIPPQINASITTFPGYGEMEPSKWDIDMLCVDNNVFARDGAKYIPYSTVSSGPAVRSDLVRDSTTNEYRAETGVSATDFTLSTSTGYQELLLAQAHQLPDGGWEVRAGMPRVAGQGENWTVDVVCLASRYVWSDFTTAP